MARRGGGKGAKKRGGSAPAAPVATGHEATTARILAAVRAHGFADFRAYVLGRTTRGDGSTWTLSEMADELEIPPAVFIGFHAAWVDSQPKT